MTIDKLNELKTEAKPLIGSDIIISKEISPNKTEFIQCVFVDINENAVEKFDSDEENKMSYSPRAILKEKESHDTYDRFPLEYVINAIKRERNIHWDFFKEYKKQNN